MAFESERRDATRLLVIVEDGTLPLVDVAPLYAEADPALVYLIFTWLRENYPASHSASDGVLGRIVALLQSNATIVKSYKSGEKDSIVKWFEDTHEYREFSRHDFVELVVEKLES